MKQNAELDIDIFYFLFAKNKISEPVKIKLLSNALEASIFYIKTKKQRYIAKIYNREFTYSKSPFLMEVMGALNNSDVDFSNIVLMEFIEDKIVVLFEYVQGKALNSWNSKQSFLVGRALSRLHCNSSSFEPTTLHEPFLDQIISLYLKVKPYLNDKFKQIHCEVDYFAVKQMDLPRGIIHGDLYDKNVLFTESSSVVFLDNAHLGYDFFLYDICHIFKKYYFDTDQQSSLDSFQSFIKGYEENRLIKDCEKEAFPEVFRARLLFSILYLFHSSLLVSQSPDLFIDSCYMNYLKLLQARKIEKIQF